MTAHDDMWQGYHGPISGDHLEQLYNELVFDAHTMPWEDDLMDMVEAVFVQARGTPGATENGRQLHRSVLQFTGKSVAEIPLLRYDPSKEMNPFTQILL